MEITKGDILPIAKNPNISLMESMDRFEFTIEKKDHVFLLQLVKTGQYMFIVLIYNGLEYQIEHLEHYMNETKDEVLKELNNILSKLNTHESRVVVKKGWFSSRFVVELNEDGSWSTFGYPSRSINR